MDKSGSTTYERVVLADRGTGLMQEIFSGVPDSSVHLLNFGFRLLPVVAGLLFTTHAVPASRFQTGSLAAIAT